MDFKYHDILLNDQQLGYYPLEKLSASCKHSALYIKWASVALGVFPQQRAVRTPLVNSYHLSRETLPGKA